MLRAPFFPCLAPEVDPGLMIRPWQDPGTEIARAQLLRHHLRGDVRGIDAVDHGIPPEMIEGPVDRGDGAFLCEALPHRALLHAPADFIARPRAFPATGTPWAKASDPFASLAAKHRLPALGFVGTADAGFLLSYSNVNRNVPVRAAELAATILKGADPANIPIEQMSEFELVVNSKTAKALGL